MSGGAGVRFTLRIDSFNLVTGTKYLKAETLPDIESWDCLGYMDGMNNIRGDMLKVKKVVYELDDNDKAYLKEEGIKPRTILYCPSFTVENMEWAGYVRGKWQNAFPMTLTGSTDIEYLGQCDISVVVDVADREEFAGFWMDVFDYYAETDVTNDDGELVTIEEQYEMINDANRANYGAKENRRK